MGSAINYERNGTSLEAVARVLGDYPEIPVGLDPVMVATSGDLLLEKFLENLFLNLIDLLISLKFESLSLSLSLS